MKAGRFVGANPQPSPDQERCRAWYAVGSLVATLALGMWVGQAQAGFVTADLSQAPYNSAKGFKSTGKYNFLSI